MGSELTPKFDQEALQRILQRAAELQAGERDVSGSLDGNVMTAVESERSSRCATAVDGGTTKSARHKSVFFMPPTTCRSSSTCKSRSHTTRGS